MKNKTKSIDDIIAANQEQIRKAKRVREVFPDVELSYLEDNSRVWMSADAIRKITGFHFIKSVPNNNYVLRPFSEIKRRNGTPYRVFTQQSYVIKDSNLILELLNKNFGRATIKDLTGNCQKLFGEVIKIVETTKAINEVLKDPPQKIVVNS